MKHRRVGKVLIFILLFVFTVCIAMQFSVFAVSSLTRYKRPDCEMTDITQIVKKDILTDGDYDLLLKQTGLTRIGVDRCRSKGVAGLNKILAIQRDNFGEYKVETDYFAPFCSANYIDKAVEACYLEEGDVLVTLSTLFSGVEIGHAGIFTGTHILTAKRYGALSSYSPVSDFTGRVSFAVLTPSADAETKKKAARYAEQNLIGKRYGIASGILGGDSTQCAYLVWYAYHMSGLDLARGIITPRKLLKSEKMQVVQYFGI